MNIVTVPGRDGSNGWDLLCVGIPLSTPTALSSLIPEPLRAPFRDALARERFEGKAESSALLTLVGVEGIARVLVLGLGDTQAEQWRNAGGLAGSRARRLGARRVLFSVPPGIGDPLRFTALAEGFALGQYRFDPYRSDREKRPPCELLGLHDSSGELGSERGELLATSRVQELHALKSALDLVRDLVNEPAETMTPLTLASYAASSTTDTLGVEILGVEQLRAQGMAGLLAVGRGSAIPPRFVHMRRVPAGSELDNAAPLPRVALVGKGVTFDAGGLDIKTADGMSTMRSDMAGAATVLGLMRLADTLDLPIELHGLFGLAENIGSGSAFKPGDVLRFANGRSVEIVNTDAEGRLLLADALCYASRLGVEHCVDIATLTGACRVALGSHYAGLFTENDSLAQELLQAAARSGEGLWRMPLSRRFAPELESEIADIKNLGSRWGSASAAALFLSNFVGPMRWAHIDIAGVAWLEKSARYLAPGATGAMFRTLLQWMRALASRAPQA